MTEDIEVYNFKPEKYTIKVAKLTKKQKEYVEAIEKYKFENGKIPSMRKIVELVDNSSPASSHRMIEILRYKGYEYKRLKYN